MRLRSMVVSTWALCALACFWVFKALVSCRMRLPLLS